MNPPIQTGLTSTSSDRRPAPSSNFVRGKSGYAPFWPGGLDSLAARPNDTDFQDGVTESKRMGAVPPGLTRGIRLSADKNRDTTSSDLFNLDGNESEAAVMVLVPWKLLLTHVFTIARGAVRCTGKTETAIAGSFVRPTRRHRSPTARHGTHHT